ncbi:hypothetical protein ACH4KU_21275 [Streptomyces althioticus]|uniref:hypothetical protein n=1 Tax=Streptomyces TaxID=1883 RepID=UPI003409BA26
MNVLLCATRGTRLTGPAGPLEEMPDRPGRSGLPGRDGGRHGPPSVPRGTSVVDPPSFGTPFVPAGPDAEYDGGVPGGVRTSGERGFPVPAGPRGTRVLHPDDVVDTHPHPGPGRLGGCCGHDGRKGGNHVCACGAEVAIMCGAPRNGYSGDPRSGHGTRLVPDAVRVEAAP